MRNHSMISIGFSGAAFAAIIAAPPAQAQSASQIIQALKPTNHLSATTRGIVPLQSGPVPAGPKPRGDASADARMHVAGRSTTPSINLNIDFALGSATLTPQAVAELNRLGHALTDPTLAAYKFKLVGHTDTTGAASTNLALSNARAKTVADYLQSKFAISAARLAALGVGETDLLVPTGPDTPNRANRRVQVINIGK